MASADRLARTALAATGRVDQLLDSQLAAGLVWPWPGGDSSRCSTWKVSTGWIGHAGSVAPGSHSPPRIRVRVHFDQVRVPANLIGQPGRHGKRTVTGAFSWTAALIGAACVGTMRAAFEYALAVARSETRLGTVPGHRAPERRLHARRHQDADRGVPLPHLEGLPFSGIKDL